MQKIKIRVRNNNAALRMNCTAAWVQREDFCSRPKMSLYGDSGRSQVRWRLLRECSVRGSLLSEITGALRSRSFAILALLVAPVVDAR